MMPFKKADFKNKFLELWQCRNRPSLYLLSKFYKTTVFKTCDFGEFAPARPLARLAEQMPRGARLNKPTCRPEGDAA